MIDRDSVSRLSETLGIKKEDMVERDIILHQILTDLSGDEFFSENFLFKGGTCLIKHHLGYYRFSEDMDFTWRNASQFDDQSAKETRRELSRIIDVIGKTLERMSSARDLDFRFSKGDREYVELGGSNKLCTFKIWYDSAVLEGRTFVKVQMNFVERMCTEPVSGRLQSLVTHDEDLKARFPEYSEYLKTISLDVYDIREILGEKIRALLTRRGMKTRDFFDVFFIKKELGIGPEDVEDCVIKKTNHAIGTYAKYKRNLGEKYPGARVVFEPDMDREFLLKTIDEEEFQEFVKELDAYIQGLISRQWPDLRL